MTPQEKPKRAITLAGGGPTAGIHLGILEYFDELNKFTEDKIEFKVWALSCIGAWVGIIYNQWPEEGDKVEKTRQFFEHFVFRDDAGYSSFPINTVFGPDWLGISQALSAHLRNPETLKNLILDDLPARAMTSLGEFLPLCADYKRWWSGDFNSWMLNHALAVNPLIRFLTSMMFLSPINGLGKVYYPDSSFLKSIKFKKLRERGKPFIYHNAWNLTLGQLEQFSNRDPVGKKYRRIDAPTLCACSALPFIEPTVEMINHDTNRVEVFCEGALVDTVNFKNLIEDHNYVDEIWVSRIVDKKQVQAPRNLTDGLGNLCQLFAATVGEDDIALFRYHVKEDKNWSGTVVEIQVPNHAIIEGKKVPLTFDWSHANLHNCRRAGYDAAKNAYEAYTRMGHPKEFGSKKPNPGVIRHIQADREFGRVPRK